MTKHNRQQLKFDVSSLTSEEVAALISTYRTLTLKVEVPSTQEAQELLSDTSSLSPAPTSVRPTAESIAAAQPTGWTPEAYQLLLDRLIANGRGAYAELLEAAIETGGSLDRDSVYGVMDWGDDRQMKGFSRPYGTALKHLISSGALPDTAVIPLDAEYDERIRGYQRAIGVVVAADLLNVLGTTAA